MIKDVKAKFKGFNKTLGNKPMPNIGSSKYINKARSLLVISGVKAKYGDDPPPVIFIYIHMV